MAKPKSLRHLSKAQVKDRLLKILSKIKKPEQLAEGEGPGCVLQRLTKNPKISSAEEFAKFGINDLSIGCLELITDANDRYADGEITKAKLASAIRQAIRENEPDECKNED